MTKYDVIFGELSAKVESGEITLEDAINLNEIAYEKYSDVEIEEAVDEDELDAISDLVAEGVLTEEEVNVLGYVSEGVAPTGANKVYVDSLRNAASEYKDTLSDVKANIKKKDFDAASKKIADCREILLQLKNTISSTPSNVTDTVLSQSFNVITSIMDVTSTYVSVSISLLMTVAAIAGANAAISGRENNDKDADGAINIAKLGAGLAAGSVISKKLMNAGKEIYKSGFSADNLNDYKKKATKAINESLVSLKTLENKVEKAKIKYNIKMNKKKLKSIR